jgi:hypothetical protein
MANAETTKRYYRHVRSGEIYAMMETRYGFWLGICGPIQYTDATPENLDNMEYTEEDIPWAERQDWERIPAETLT